MPLETMLEMICVLLKVSFNLERFVFPSIFILKQTIFSQNQSGSKTKIAKSACCVRPNLPWLTGDIIVGVVVEFCVPIVAQFVDLCLICFLTKRNNEFVVLATAHWIELNYTKKQLQARHQSKITNFKEI